MKIAFVTKISMPGKRGVCFAIAQMCHAFSQNGHQVKLILPNREIDQSLRNENFWDYFQIQRNSFEIKKLPAIVLPRFNIREIVLGWSFSLVTFIYFIFQRPSYVHLFTECKELLVLLRIFSWLYHPTVVYEVHVLPHNPYEKILDWLGVPVANLVISTTQNVAGHYKSKVKLVKVVPSGINLESFDYKTPKTKIRQRLGVATNKIIIGYGGRFVTDKMEKGIPDLIRAVSILKKNYKNMILFCVGGPAEYVNKYRLLSKKSGLTAREAIFLDHVPPSRLYEYMRVFDVCVMPFPNNPHFAYIMSPLKMFEYMASKNPIVATNLPSVKEVLTNGETALLAKPGNHKDIALNIDLLIRDQKLGRRLSKAAFLLVAKTHTWRKRQRAIIAAVSN